MLLNHARERVQEFNDPGSYCPECKVPLIAKRGTIKIWHWAHRPTDEPRPCSRVGETEWHTQMKVLALELPDWTVEHPLKVGAKQYFLDAFNPVRNQALEFIHSHNPDYEIKHEDLRKAKVPCIWIAHGDALVSEYRILTRSGYEAAGFLKPKARELRDCIPFIVLWGGVFWREASEASDLWSVIREKDELLDFYRMRINA